MPAHDNGAYVYLTHTGYLPELQSTIDEFADKGWRVVSAAPKSGQYEYFLLVLEMELSAYKRLKEAERDAR